MNITVDDLDLGETLGTGTVGQVYRGSVKSTGEDVAVKFLQSGISSDALVRARFQREMSILQRLDHPHIIRYFGGGKHDGQLYYVMDVIDGGNIRDLLDRYGTLNWQEVASIGRQVCSALQHAHNHGIVHRDLKPSNLFITSQASVKLGDFGIARDTNSADITNQGLTVGTHSYMAPEQIRANGEVTGKADLYSLGCVLFELISGHKPFPGTNFANLFEQHLFKEAPSVTEFVSDVPSELVNIIAQLLHKDPDQRPFNARAVQGVMMSLNSDGPQEQAGQSSGDVGAGEVLDPGMRTLRLKLQPGQARQVSWKALAIIGGVAVAIIGCAVMASNL